VWFFSIPHLAAASPPKNHSSSQMTTHPDSNCSGRSKQLQNHTQRDRQLSPQARSSKIKKGIHSQRPGRVPRRGPQRRRTATSAGTSSNLTSSCDGVGPRKAATAAILSHWYSRGLTNIRWYAYTHHAGSEASTNTAYTQVPL